MHQENGATLRLLPVSFPHAEDGQHWGGSERFRKIRDIVENKKPMSARHLRIHAPKNV
jgi:hypothetical protein